MADYSYPVNPAYIPLNLWLTINDYPSTGKTPTVSIRELEHSGYYLDFADNYFKNAGWTTRYQNLTSAIDGLYTYSWNPNGAFTSNTTVESIYYNTGGTTTTAQVAVDTIRIYQYNFHAVGGGGNVNVQGVWSKKEKEKLFDRIDSLQEILDKLVRSSSEDVKLKLGDYSKMLSDLRKDIFIKEELENEVWDELGKFNDQI